MVTDNLQYQKLFAPSYITVTVQLYKISDCSHHEKDK